MTQLVANLVLADSPREFLPPKEETTTVTCRFRLKKNQRNHLIRVYHQAHVSFVSLHCEMQGLHVVASDTVVTCEHDA